MNLEQALGRAVRSETRRPSPYRTSHRIEEIDVVLADGTELALLLKELGDDALTAEARRAKPAELRDPGREAAAYELLAPHGLGEPELVAHGDDWILLERVEGGQLRHFGGLDAWQEAARWLARAHARFAALPPVSAHLLDYGADWFAARAERARTVAGRSATTFLDGYDRVVERLASLPRTLVHGEYYPTNVLVAGTRIAPVDWELAGVGPGLLDLAALVAGAWDESERDAICAAYRVADREALDCCRLHVAVQWLGWADEWTPPEEHAHDWLADARSLRERLEL